MARASLCAALFVVYGNLLAQDADRASQLRDAVVEQLGIGEWIEDVSPETDEQSSHPTGKVVADGESKDVEMLPALIGLILVRDPALVSKSAIHFENQAIETNDVSLPPGAELALESFLGKPLTMRLLDDANLRIHDLYRKADRPVVDVYLPEQDISGGVVQLIVLEGKVGAIKVEGAEYSDRQKLIDQLHLKPGTSIRRSILETDLKWLNDHPFRQVNAVFEPGDEDGLTNVVLKTEDSKPVRLHTGIDNLGLDLTGDQQFNAGITWGHVFGTDQLLAYQYTSDLEFDGLNAHSGFYRIPLPWRHYLDLLGAYVSSDVEMMVDGETISIGGQSVLAGLNYVIPVWNPPLGFEKWEFELGSEYKSTNSDVEFGGANVFDETASILQFYAGFEGQRPDSHGGFGVEGKAFWSPGDLVGNNDTESFGMQRADATPAYFYTELTIERLLNLPRKLQLAFSATGQWSPDRLISTEQLLAGGYHTVRGFDENLVRGDVGLVGSLELLIPPIALLKGRQNALHPALFYDGAWLRSVDGKESEPNQNLSSAGVDLRYQIGRTWSLRAGYGWHVSSDGLNAVEGNGKFHFGATIFY